MIDIDIVDLLRDYASLLDEGSVQRMSIESRIVLSAVGEIVKLRKMVDFYREEADRNNKSRLVFMDWNLNAERLYEDLCKGIRSKYIDDFVCGMCRYDCDHGIEGYANECPGFTKDECFELDRKKWTDLISGKGVDKVTPIPELPKEDSNGET